MTPAHRAFSHAGGAPGLRVQAPTGCGALVPEKSCPAVPGRDDPFADVSQGEVWAVDVDDGREA